MNELYDFSSDVENPEKNYIMARWYENHGHTAPAHSFYLRAAERSSDASLAYKALIRASLCYKAQGSRSGTEKVLLENALMVLPRRPEAYYFLSLIYGEKGDWQNCYINASLGFDCKTTTEGFSSLLDDIPEYPGEYLLLHQKAVSAWWWGKGEECRRLFGELVEGYWEILDDKYKFLIQKNLERMGLEHIVPVINKKFFDCGTHLFQGFKQVSKLHGIDRHWECYCFEANHKTYEASKPIRLELINKGLNIKHFNNAVASSNGNAKLNIAQSDIWDGAEIGTYTSQSSNILLDPPKSCGDRVLNYEKRDLVVKTIDFSEFIRMFSAPEDFVVVKLDVEGSEFEILDKMIDDGTIGLVNEFYIEFHPNHFENSEVLEDKIKSYEKTFLDLGINFTRWT